MSSWNIKDFMFLLQADARWEANKVRYFKQKNYNKIIIKYLNNKKKEKEKESTSKFEILIWDYYLHYVFLKLIMWKWLTIFSWIVNVKVIIFVEKM